MPEMRASAAEAKA